MKNRNPFTEPLIKSSGFMKDWWDETVEQSRSQKWNPMGPIVRGWDRVGHGSYDATGGIINKDLDQVLDGVQQMGSGTVQAGGSALLSGGLGRASSGVLSSGAKSLAARPSSQLVGNAAKWTGNQAMSKGVPAVKWTGSKLGKGIGNASEAVFNPVALLNRGFAGKAIRGVPDATHGLPRRLIQGWARRADEAPSMVKTLRNGGWQAITHPVRSAKTLFKPSNYRPLAQGKTYTNFLKDRAAITGSSILGAGAMVPAVEALPVVGNATRPILGNGLIAQARDLKDYESSVFSEDPMGWLGSSAATAIDNSPFLLSKGAIPGLAYGAYDAFKRRQYPNPYTTGGHEFVANHTKAKYIPDLSTSQEANRLVSQNPKLADPVNEQDFREHIKNQQAAVTYKNDSGSRYFNPFAPAGGADFLNYLGTRTDKEMYQDPETQQFHTNPYFKPKAHLSSVLDNFEYTPPAPKPKPKSKFWPW